MKTAKHQISKEIAKLQKEYKKLMDKYYKSMTDELKYGDGNIIRQADEVDKHKIILEKSLMLIEQYERETAIFN